MIRKNQAKYKYNCLKPEDITINTDYTFSYNPEEQPLFDKFYKMKLNNLKDWSQRMLQIFSHLRFSTITVVQEISQKGRFHYHGWININKLPEFIIHDLAYLRHYGTYEIDVVSNEDIWLKYVFKQERFMRKYCTVHEMYYEIDTTDNVEKRKPNFDDILTATPQREVRKSED